MQLLVRRIMPSAAFASIPVLSLSLFATLSIYAGNSDEFSVSYIELLLAYLPFVVIVIGALGSLGVLMTERGRGRYVAVLSALAILFWLQGNILVWDYGVLDGREINWMLGAWRGILDLSIWAVVLLLAISWHARVGKVLQFAAIATLAIQLVSAVTMVTGVAKGELARPAVVQGRSDRDAVFDFSPDSNVVHIVMDGFQSDIFSQIVSSPANGDLKSELSGFTFFRKHTGVYPYTQLTIPAFLSGKLYRNEIPVKDFVSRTMQGETILNAAAESGFEVDIAAPIALANVYSKGKHSNSFGITSSAHATAEDYVEIDSAKLIDLAIFRVVPHFAKALVHRDELWLFQGMVNGASYLNLQYFSDLAFLRRMSTEMTAERTTPVYKMFHLMLSHQPTVGNEHCLYDRRRPATREAVTWQARCGLVHVLNVIRRMKELGIYENSLIILMGDHGAWVPVEQLTQASSGSAGVEPEVGATTIAMAIPVLAVKPPGAGSTFTESDAQTSMIDLPATIADILGLEQRYGGVPAYSASESLSRERHHFVYGYGINPKAEGYLFPMQEYLINGDPFDAQAWRKGRRYMPAGIVEDNEH